MKQASGSLGTVLKYVLIVVLLLVLAGAGWATWNWYHSGGQGASYRTEKVTRGKLVATISSTGTVEPEEVIDVGAQVAGQILRFGPDPDDSSKTVDYRSNVRQGTILAELDDALFRARVEQAKADLESKKADLESKKADLAVAARDWARSQRLHPTGGIAESDYEVSRGNFETKTAAIKVAEAAVGQAEAALNEANTNLGYTVIKSPVKGVIIDRRVNVGQTVVASLSAPSLFLIAKDLTRVQVWVSVNEADISNIKKGQEATFTVDTYPGEVFKGVVTKVRLNAQMTQNVVTYTVEVTTDNKDGRLLPYLTANVKFKVDERTDALLVPNSALRWRPSAAQVHPDYRSEYQQSLRRKLGQGGEGGDAEKEALNRATVWVEDGPFVRPVKIRTGLTDGVNTEVLTVEADRLGKVEALEKDTPLVVGEQKGAPVGGANPFVPQMFKKKE
jgi:HlyD family secretion protein